MREQTLILDTESVIFFSLLDRLTNEPYSGESFTNSQLQLNVSSSAGAIENIDISSNSVEHVYGSLYQVILTAAQAEFTYYTSGVLTFVADEVQPVQVPFKVVSTSSDTPSEPEAGDSIEAIITANIKSVLETITTDNAYNTNIEYVEEMRSEYKTRNGNTALIQVDDPVYNDDFDHTGDITYKFSIIYFAKHNDLGNNDPFQYHNRNVVADIQKALMVDRTRGGYSQNTEIEGHGHENFLGGSGELLPATYILVSCPTLINSNNPYELGA